MHVAVDRRDHASEPTVRGRWRDLNSAQPYPGDGTPQATADRRMRNRHRSVLRLAKNAPVQSSAAANAGGYWSFPRTAESYARSGYTCAASDGAQSGRSMVMPKSGANRNPNRP